MNTRATPTREGERRARLLASGELGVMTRSTSTSPAGSGASATSPRLGPSTSSTGASTSRGRKKTPMPQRRTENSFADASNEDASASTSGTRAISSFFLSQSSRPRAGRRSGDSSSSQRDEGQDEVSVSRTGRRQTSQRRLADLSALTNASDDDEDDEQGGGRSFTTEAAYANRLDASAAHIGQLLSRNGRSARGAQGKGKQRLNDDDQEQPQKENADDDEEEDDDEETSDPDAAKRKHGHRSTPNGASQGASSSQNKLDTPSREKRLPSSRLENHASPQSSSGLLPSLRNLASSAFSSLQAHPSHVLLGIVLLSYMYLNSGTGSLPGLTHSPDALSALTKTTTKLSQRVTNAEAHISRLGKVQGQHSGAMETLQTRVSTLELSASERDEHVRKWKAELSDGRTREEAELGRWKKEVEAALKEERELLEKEITKLQDELERRQKLIAADARKIASAASASVGTAASENKESQAQLKKFDAELRRMADRLADVDSDLGNTRRELSALDKRSSAAQARADEALHAIQDDPTSWLSTYLPSLVPVRWEHSPSQKGKSKGAAKPELRIDEAFWADLRTHFVSHADALKMVEASKSATVVESAAPRPAELKQEDLQKIAANEVRRTLDGNIADGVLLDRASFMVLLQKELRLASAALERKIQTTQKDVELEKKEREEAVENLQQVHHDLVETVQVLGQEKAPSRDGSRWPFSWGGTGSGTDGPAGSGGLAEDEARGDTDSRTRVIELVDQALELYSLDKLGRPDYALYSAGARVLPALTSRSYGQSGTPSRLSAPKFWSWPTGGKKTEITYDAGLASGRGRPPVTALHPDISPGMCWAFPGSRGTLGIKLARRNVRVSHVTIEHAPERLLKDRQDLEAKSPIRSAPRRLEVWGRVVGGQVEWARAQAFNVRQAAEASRARLRRGGSSGEEESLKPEGAKTGRWIRLGEFEYGAGGKSYGSVLQKTQKWSPGGHSHIQTFAVDSDVANLQIGVDAVQVGVLSNHGNQAYTCLYRVRIHGEPQEDDEVDADDPNGIDDTVATGLDSLV
ncbi:hypothetical protein A4X09_0g4564 [Tilletia walkeri]|uniref:SUN domain-containing protein n=1 Tax=Tilletia walkeri TaxID=117179 RepID=A0A8X7N938_9BASI|nr:hypothetical protein A4X09_0g4564 [Tilletia walkeri]